MPERRFAKGGSHRFDESRVRFDAVFEKQGPDFEHALAAMRFRLQWSDQFSVMRDWQHEIAKAPFGRWRVALQGVVEAKHHTGTRAVPEHRIKRGQQCRKRGPQAPEGRFSQRQGVITVGLA